MSLPFIQLPWSPLIAVFCLMLASPDTSAWVKLSVAERVEMLNDLGVQIAKSRRPPFQGSEAREIRVRLVRQGNSSGKQTVSFGVPFAPNQLNDHTSIRVLNDSGEEIPAYTQGIVRWWIDGNQGSWRSVLIQFEIGSDDQSVRVRWGEARKVTRETRVPIQETQTAVEDDGFIYYRPKVMALLPPDWLCSSLVGWQQIPAAGNRVATWFDQHQIEYFPKSLEYLSSDKYAPHLYDRPATYAKIYIRHGDAEHLSAALRSADFYVQHLDEVGFFTLKPGDHKYVYAEGPTLLYLLTGDPRYRDAALRTLDSWAKWNRVAYTGEGFWTERHVAFGMAAYLHTYELTGDPRLLEKATRFFEGVYRIQVRPLDGGAPNGAWVHTSESHGDGNGWTTSPWMSALLMDSIWKLWMLTGDDRCPESLAMYAKYIDRYAVTPDRQRLYYMANSPGRGESVNPERPPHHVEACYMLAMGYYLSNGEDGSLLETMERLWPPVMHDNANTPPRKFTWRFRETSMLVWFLEQVVK